jgi:DNA polymerase III delta subunit
MNYDIMTTQERNKLIFETQMKYRDNMSTQELTELLRELEELDVFSRSNFLCDDKVSKDLFIATLVNRLKNC